MFVILCTVLVLTLKGCENRSISFVIKHQDFFAVQDAEDRGHIPLSETQERFLVLTDFGTSDANSQNDGSSNNDDPLGAVTNKVQLDYGHGYNNHGDIDNDDDDDDDDDEEDVDDEMNGTRLEDFHAIETQSNRYSKSNDVNYNDFDIESISGLKNVFRKKRSAHEQWKNTLPGAKAADTTEDTEPDVWEEVSDEELEKAKMHTYKQTLKYAGLTLLSVSFFVFVGICFLRDPVACIFAFGTGCPCCLICCPCIRAFTDKYLDSKKIVREQMNKYMPGVIVNDDGSLDRYDPTQDEIDALAELIDEVSP